MDYFGFCIGAIGFIGCLLLIDFIRARDLERRQSESRKRREKIEKYYLKKE